VRIYTKNRKTWSSLVHRNPDGQRQSVLFCPINTFSASRQAFLDHNSNIHHSPVPLKFSSTKPQLAKIHVQYHAAFVFQESIPTSSLKEESCPIQPLLYGLPFSVAFWCIWLMWVEIKILSIEVLPVWGLVKDTDSKNVKDKYKFCLVGKRRTCRMLWSSPLLRIFWSLVYL